MGDLLATFKDTALFFACKRIMSEMKSCISGILNLFQSPNEKTQGDLECKHRYIGTAFLKRSSHKNIEDLGWTTLDISTTRRQTEPT